MTHGIPMALQVVEAAEDLKLLEAETAQLRGKMPLRQAALKAARHEGEAGGRAGEVKKGGEDFLSCDVGRAKKNPRIFEITG